jgi:hypothetical protein
VHNWSGTNTLSTVQYITSPPIPLKNLWSLYLPDSPYLPRRSYPICLSRGTIQLDSRGEQSNSSLSSRGDSPIRGWTHPISLGSLTLSPCQKGQPNSKWTFHLEGPVLTSCSNSAGRNKPNCSVHCITPIGSEVLARAGRKRYTLCYRDRRLNRKTSITSSDVPLFEKFFLVILKGVRGYYCIDFGTYYTPSRWWYSGCGVLHYFNNNSNNMTDRNGHNFTKVSRIGTVEYMFQLNFLREIEPSHLFHSIQVSLGSSVGVKTCSSWCCVMLMIKEQPTRYHELLGTFWSEIYGSHFHDFGNMFLMSFHRLELILGSARCIVGL